MKRFFLVDCNNFYVSCERVFNPRLHKKPVVVLGSNDACVIARSNEAKALGIQMGVPAFECEALFKKHGVIIYSANFALYGDMSNRVMQTLTSFAANIEIYSVDEAFLFVSDHDNQSGMHHTHPDYYLNYAQQIKTAVKQQTGIPVSVGIGPTKTLAKIANKLAKKNALYAGACDSTDHPALDTMLATIPVADIWGIGYRYAALLERNHIMNARDFKYADERWVRKNMTIVGLKTLYELRGISCLSLQECPKPKDSITVSRSFGKRVTTLAHAQEALASYVTTAAAKVRAQKSLVGRLTIFAVSTRLYDPQYHFQSKSCQLPLASDYTPTLIAAAYQCLQELFQPGRLYKKVGILCDDLVPRDFHQMSMLAAIPKNHTRQTLCMDALDRINTKWGRDTLFFAAAGIQQPWKMYQANKSACFTTNWHELLTITV